MNKIVPFLILCVLTQGCVGIGVQRTKTESFQDPHRFFDPGWVHETNSTDYTATWLESHRGKPTKISRAEATGLDEIWTYKQDLNWNGVVLYVLIIPIPLVVPVGREQVQFVIRDGHVISVETRFMQTVGGVVGYLPTPCGFTGFGVHSLSDY